jgi:hypothetical protein
MPSGVVMGRIIGFTPIHVDRLGAMKTYKCWNDFQRRPVEERPWRCASMFYVVPKERACGPRLPFGPLHVLATLLAVPLHEEYRLSTPAGDYLVLHGDRFDPTLNWPILTDTADWCYGAVQKINKKASQRRHPARQLCGRDPAVNRRRRVQRQGFWRNSAG